MISTPTTHLTPSTTTSAPPPSRPVTRVRPLAPGDLDATAAWQAAAGLDHRSALGHAFLRRWQLAQLGSPHAVALVAERAGGVCGVLLAVTDRAAHHDHLRREHGPALTAAGAAAALRRPRVVGRWLRHRSGPVVTAVTLLPTRGDAAARARGTGAPLGAPAAPPSAEVVEVDAVLVDPGARGTGVGRELLTALTELRTGAARAQALVPWGSGAEGFFSACGWVASPTRPSPSGGLVTPFSADLAA